jgi:2-methylcitrate dehydratase PrpD
MSGFTAAVAERAAALQRADIPADVTEIARQCVLDWFGVTVAGSCEPAAALVRDVLIEDGADRGVTVVGTGVRLPPIDAALANGVASHALDYDDVNQTMLGHPSVAILGALLAVGEANGASGADIVCAFVAGYNALCDVAGAVGPSHYQRGFHATGTIGTLGAAAACARLLGLDASQTSVALGLAVTQAAGLKSMFGTMAKPFHAGKACANGLLAARLAGAGFTANAGAVEAVQGLAEAMGGTVPTEGPGDVWHVRGNLFKYHAACYETHSTIEGVRRLRAEKAFEADDVASITIHASQAQLRMCAIPEPTSGLETKFSLRHVAALAALDADTSAIETFGDAVAVDPVVVAVRERVRVLDDGASRGPTVVDIVLADGRTLQAAHDVYVPERDLAAQADRLENKFHRLAGPVLGYDRAIAVVAALRELESVDDVGKVLALTAT